MGLQYEISKIKKKIENYKLLDANFWFFSSQNSLSRSMAKITYYNIMVNDRNQKLAI